MALRLKKLGSPLFLAGLLMMSSLNASAAADPFNDGKPTPLAMVTDLALIRPVGIIATVAGSAVWLLATPFTLPIGGGQEAAEKLVYEPALYTFARCLGCTRVGYHISAVEELDESAKK